MLLQLMNGYQCDAAVVPVGYKEKTHRYEVCKGYLSRLRFNVQVELARAGKLCPVTAVSDQ
jgi:hypothetical protein